MRVNIYAEELTDRVTLETKEIEGQAFTAVRFWLALPVSYVQDPVTRTIATLPNAEKEPDGQLKGPFIHHVGDDDSSAVTFWGKKDMRPLLRRALQLLDQHYAESDAGRAGARDRSML